MKLDDLAKEHATLGAVAFRAVHDTPVLLSFGDRDEGAAGFHTHLAARPTPTPLSRAAALDLLREASPDVFEVKKRPGGAFEDRIGVGRARNADVHVAFTHLSKYHAYFVVDGGVSLADAGSKNGTFLDGKRLEPRVLAPVKDGAEIQLGPYLFRFHTADGLLAVLARMPR